MNDDILDFETERKGYDPWLRGYQQQQGAVVANAATTATPEYCQQCGILWDGRLCAHLRHVEPLPPLPAPAPSPLTENEQMDTLDLATSRESYDPWRQGRR